MKVGIAGVGVVGGAVLRAFAAKTSVVGYDISEPFKDNFYKLLDCSLIFVCLPSPTVNNTQDLSAIFSFCRRLASARYQGVVCIKSTVLPGTCDKLADQFMLRICHNPEFLTAARPYEDFMEQKAIIVGGPITACTTVAEAYRQILPVPVLMYPSAKTTEIAKYTRNCFLALKVAFANEIFDICQHNGVEYNSVLEAMLSQGGVEHGHWRVPGPDGKRGYSGMCLPKDTVALSAYCEDNALTLYTIDGAIAKNQEIRPHDENAKESV